MLKAKNDFVRFGTICTIQKTWKTPVEECYIQYICKMKPATLLKLTLPQRSFLCFILIVRMVPNLTKWFYGHSNKLELKRNEQSLVISPVKWNLLALKLVLNVHATNGSKQQIPIWPDHISQNVLCSIDYFLKLPICNRNTFERTISNR